MDSVPALGLVERLERVAERLFARSIAAARTRFDKPVAALRACGFCRYDEWRGNDGLDDQSHLLAGSRGINVRPIDTSKKVCALDLAAIGVFDGFFELATRQGIAPGQNKNRAIVRTW